MRKFSASCDLLSDRILIIRNTFNSALETGAGLDHQQARTMLALLDESYEDSLLLEAAILVRKGQAPAKVLQFPRQHIRPHLVHDAGDAS